MDFEFSARDEAFRREVRTFLETRLTEDMRAATRRTATVFTDLGIAMRWQRILVEQGWAVPHWPVEFGGTDWSPTQHYIFGEECARAHAPGLIPMGLRMLAPVLFRYGTEAQKATYLPRMLSGEHYWCQGYSEPGSGSDLSSLKTRAVADGEDYIVDGTKIWTTHAQFANHIFCLVRTRTEGKPQGGISFLLIPMDLAGISVRPIITMAGDHEVNQVFFEGVRVPQSNRVGPENEGWTVAKYLLEFERGSTGSAMRLRVALDELRALAGSTHVGDGTLLDDSAFADRLAALEVQLAALAFAEMRGLARLSAGGSPGPESSLAKNSAVALGQAIEQLHVEAAAWWSIPAANAISLGGLNEPWIGPEGTETATPAYLNGRAASIFGGSEQVQKNIIAKAVLGL